MNQIIQKNNKLAWFIWGIAAVYVLYQFLLQASTSIMVPCLEKDLCINTLDVSFLSSSFFYTYLTLQIPAGILVDRLGPRKILAPAIAVCAVASIVFGFSDHMLTAEASRMLMGLVTAPAVVCAMYLAAKWFPSSRFALLAGLTEAVGISGGAVGQALLARCIDGSLGWRGTMFLCGAVGFVLAFLAWVFVYDSPRQKAKLPCDQTECCITWQSCLQVLLMPQAWLLGLVSGLLFAVLTAFAAFWSVPFLMKAYCVSLRVAGLASAMVFLGVVFGTPVFGAISDRLGRRKWPMLVSSVLGFICVWPIILWHLPLALMFILLFILGFVSAGYVIPFAAVSDIVSDKLKATAMGFTNMMCIIIGAPLLQPVIGYLLEKTGRYEDALFVLPACFALAFILLFFVKETYQEKLTNAD